MEYTSAVMQMSAKEGLPKVKGFIGAEFDTNVEIVENAVHYMVDVEMDRKQASS